MPRKSVRFLVAGLTMVLFWVASWMGKSRPSDLALAQNAGGAGERRTVIGPGGHLRTGHLSGIQGDF
jgi:hypothetical protein